MAKDSVFLEGKAAPSLRVSQTVRMLGYLLVIIVNIALLALVNFVIRWDSVSFLTPRYKDVLWLLNVSLVAGVLANYFFIVSKRQWFNALCRVLTGGITLALLARLLQVFPFNFAADTGFDWAQAVRIFLIVTLVLTALGTLVELGRFVAAAVRQK